MTDDLTEGEVGRYVMALAESVPSVDPPVAAVVRAARVAARRRSRRRAAVAVVAVAAAVVAVLVVPKWVRSAHSSRPAPAQPPAGTRLVGADDWVVAVPDTWTQTWAPQACEAGVPDSYYLDDAPAGPGLCPTSVIPVGSTLEITVGPAATSSAVVCALGACEARWAGGSSVTFHARVVGSQSDARAQLEQIRASTHHLPVGFTTVPAWRLSPGGTPSLPIVDGFRDDVRQAGLRVADGSRLPTFADLRTTTPAQGSAVRTGSTVLIGGPLTPTAPTGMRLVGAHGVAIAVPASWTGSTPGPCTAAAQDTFWVGQLAQQCHGVVLTTTSLQIDPTATVPPHSGPAPDLHGHRAAGSGGHDDYFGVGCTPDVCTGTWQVGHRATFTATLLGDPVSGRALLQRMQDSIQFLPSAWTTVPEWRLRDTTFIGAYTRETRGRYVADVRAAHLVARLGAPPTAGTERPTEPAQGTVVRTGTTVTVGEPLAPSTRVVGYRGYEMAVPASWRSSGVVLCSPPSGDYVETDDPDQRFAVSCAPILHQGPPGSHLVMSPAPAHPEGTVTRRIGDADVHERGSCSARACTHTWTVDGGTRFSAVVRGADAEHVVVAMGRSLAAVPAGDSIVPDWPDQGLSPTSDEGSVGPVTPSAFLVLLAADGLRGEPAPTVKGESDQGDPGGGSVVPRGTTVRVPGLARAPAQAPRPAPSGMQLVGARGDAIAVPGYWVPTDQAMCGGSALLSFAVITSNGPPIRCPGSPAPKQGVQQLQITDAQTDAVTPFGLTDDAAPVCHGSVCEERWTDTAHDVRFTVVVTGDEPAARLGVIAATYQRLPDGWTTVPVWTGPQVHSRVSPAAYARYVRAAGLQPHQTSDGFGGPGDELTEPMAGTVQVEGSVVGIGYPCADGQGGCTRNGD